VLSQQECIDRHDHDIFVSVHDHGRVLDPVEYREAIARRYDAPFTDRGVSRSAAALDVHDFATRCVTAPRWSWVEAASDESGAKPTATAAEAALSSTSPREATHAGYEFVAAIELPRVGKQSPMRLVRCRFWVSPASASHQNRPLSLI
jgi:hypothetical protein